MRHTDLISREVLKLYMDIDHGKRGLITLKEYQGMRLNSYDRELLLTYLDIDAFRETVGISQKHVQPLHRPGFPPGTYDESCIHLLLPEAMARIDCLDNAVRDLQKALLNQAKP